MFLRQSTASQEIVLGPFIDDTASAQTGLTIANTDIKLFKHGATSLADKNSGGGTHMAGGNYSAVLDATDTSTVGMLEVLVHVSGALPVRRVYWVLEEAVYDAFYAASATGFMAAADDAVLAAISTVDGKVDTIDSNVDAALADTNELQTDWADGGRLDLILDARASQTSVDDVDNFVDTEVAAIKAKTDNLPSDPADASDIAAAFASLDAKVDTIDNFLDTEVAAILADTNELQTDLTDGGRLDLLIDAIKAVTDVLVASQAEPTGVPSATASPLVKLAHVFMMLCNGVDVTDTKKTFKDASGNAEFEKDVADDGTTYSESRVNSI